MRTISIDLSTKDVGVSIWESPYTLITSFCLHLREPKTKVVLGDIEQMTKMTEKIVQAIQEYNVSIAYIEGSNIMGNVSYVAYNHFVFGYLKQLLASVVPVNEARGLNQAYKLFITPHRKTFPKTRDGNKQGIKAVVENLTHKTFKTQDEYDSVLMYITIQKEMIGIK